MISIKSRFKLCQHCHDAWPHIPQSLDLKCHCIYLPLAKG